MRLFPTPIFLALNITALTPTTSWSQTKAAAPVGNPNLIRVARDLQDALRVKIEAFFLAYGADKSNQAQVATLKEIRRLSGFRTSDNTQLKAVSILEMHNEIGKVEGNTALSADQKKQRLADISTEVQKLNTLIATPQQATLLRH
ncbi:MAG: hypothetical protein LH481_00560 [Burkholderiales bacterium]|nr:hypothetical protein [Burkholderiales bacterium]